MSAEVGSVVIVVEDSGVDEALSMPLLKEEEVADDDKTG
jgi:hypothetical protein